MAIVDFIAAHGSWSWIIAGLALLALELVVPGGFMLWLGISGIVTGLLSTFIAMDWPLEWSIFGVLSLVTIFLWVRFFKRGNETSDRPYLNRRADRFVGHEVVLDEPIADGYGRVALGDTVWRVAGPDLKAGQRVRIVGHDGAVLRVELAQG
jgi:membrane protein implicated in regulation of membrane protease activity